MQTQQLIDAGWHLVRVRLGTKKPQASGWPDLPPAPLAGVSNANVGCIFGARSGGIVDIDLDCPEARHMAEVFLDGHPGWRRASSPLASHRLTHCPEFQEHVVLQLPKNGKMVLELRASPKQMSVIPPSYFESKDGTRDHLVWVGNPLTPPTMDADTLRSLAAWTAILAMLYRHYPQQGRDNYCLAVAGAMLHMGIPEELAERALARLVEHPNEDSPDQRLDKVRRTYAKDKEDVTGLPYLCRQHGLEELLPTFREWLGAPPEGSPDTDGDTALELAQVVAGRMGNHLILWRDDFYVFNGVCYEIIENDLLRKRVYETFPQFSVKGVNIVMDALRAVATPDVAPDELHCWLEERPDLRARDLIVCHNGLLHVPTGELLPHDPNLFTTSALEFDYDPGAPPPVQWLAFLQEVWPDDAECRQTLQRMFGYLLTPDTSQQKIFAIIGPPRSGKGTIGRVLAELLGRRNITSPTLTSLGSDFGLQSLIGKQLAIMSDVRIGKAGHTVVETLLRVSGEDNIAANRKWQKEWHGRLTTRFLLMGNELPDLPDSSMALVRRFILLPMSQSFLGREDPALTDRLLQELPGILNWAIEGRRLLATERAFHLPASGREALRIMDDMASPVSGFVRDCCELDQEATVRKERLYKAYLEWCSDNGIRVPTSSSRFGRDLRAAFPGRIGEARLRDGEDRTRAYRGLRLRADERVARAEEAFGSG
ncbi:MAG TPA: phage/plasmid primase, P4 family [Hyphomonas sp.]|nr:phage/plasmid primase, P4 family [Hyphomonas sp.]